MKRRRPERLQACHRLRVVVERAAEMEIGAPLGSERAEVLLIALANLVVGAALAAPLMDL